MADPELTEQPEVTVEVAADTEKPGRPQLSDEEVEKLAELPPDDEVGRYARDAQKRIKSLHLVNQEWRRRVIQSNKDVATATSLAEQLYRENQELKGDMGRREVALIEQAIQRAEAQLSQAKTRARAAYAAQNPDEIVASNEEVSRYVAEVDRLRLLKPVAATSSAAGAAPGPEPGAAPPPVTPGSAVQLPPKLSPGVQNWLAKNTWFNKPGEEEMTGFAMGIHKSLENQGITEDSNPQAYWGAIDRRLREVYPQKFAGEKPPAEKTETVEPSSAGGRPVTVAPSTRVNGAANGGAAGVAPRSPRHIVLSESQVRIAKGLGLTPEQYAAQLVKEGKEKP